MRINIGEFQRILPEACTRSTSADPRGWTPENPLYGHCAVVALLAQDLFGGQLLRASLEGTPHAHMRSHYVNEIPKIGTMDFTAPQFGSLYPTNLTYESRDRDYLMSNKETAERYLLLKSHLELQWGEPLDSFNQTG